MSKQSRRLAALKGWRTRRHNERSAAAKRGWKTRRRNEHKQPRKKPQKINHILTVQVKSPRKRNGRSTSQTFKRDIVIPAPRGTSLSKLMDIARKTLTGKERYAADWFDVKGRKITVAEGPRTRARKATLR